MDGTRRRRGAPSDMPEVGEGRKAGRMIELFALITFLLMAGYIGSLIKTKEDTENENDND